MQNKNTDSSVTMVVNSLLAVAITFLLLVVLLGSLVFSHPPKSWVEEGERRRAEKLEQLRKEVDKYRELGIPEWKVEESVKDEGLQRQLQEDRYRRLRTSE